MARPITRAGLASAAVSAALAAAFLLFAWAHACSFARHPRPSAILLVGLEALFAVFFLVRAPADRAALGPGSWASTAGGTFLPLLLRPADAAMDLLAGQVLQVAGVAFGIYALLSLNRSFGLVPAHRGVRSTGAYRWVRHPLYAAYAVITAGYLASNVGARNVAILLLAYSCQVWRIFNEERLLARYPEYVAYRTRTRWRLVPFVF
ncbi:MAG TPA: isoprenylcysteine carboxylmethyltransferase family protein [Anaeromyxobacter sp.]